VDRAAIVTIWQMTWTLATEKITSYKYWPLFLPRDLQTLTEKTIEELHERCRARGLAEYCPEKEQQTLPPSRTSEGAPPSADNV
jgi:hypothetical protein